MSPAFRKKKFGTH